MSDPTRFHMRITVADRAYLARLAREYGVSESDIVRMAIRFYDQHGPMQGKGETGATASADRNRAG